MDSLQCVSDGLLYILKCRRFIRCHPPKFQVEPYLPEVLVHHLGCKPLSRVLHRQRKHNKSAEHVSKPTRFGPNRGSSLSGWIITHATEDIANQNILLLLATSNHAVLSFTFGASDLKDDQVEPHPNVWIAAKTDWSVDTNSSVGEARSLSQLFYDGFQTMAVNLVNLVSPSAACGPSNRLFRLVKLGLSASEDEHEKSGVIEGESIAPGTGIDLEVESESSTMAPEAALYETCYVTAHKAACRAASFNSTGQLVATGSHDSSIKILDVERMLAKSVSPTDHLGQETPQQQMETHPVIRTLYDHTAVKKFTALCSSFTS
ncbi:unnamed protein product [Schistosoma curassoni]|uniref:Cleavage stimulation factor 50 kDa subunit n=1 Tax=Schistosoma curassoni TaxID=6186 RepID=A0A183KKU8_9TREM|nr:unnamed protein product [Schistosoma curassoni]